MHTNTRFAVGVHILTLLAQAGDEPITSDFMAGSVNTNPVVIRRVLGYLRRAGMVASQPGNRGGWTLRQRAEALTLRAIYQAVVQEQAIAIHERPNPVCPVGRVIQRSLEQVIDRAQEALEASLGTTTIADVLADVHRRAAA
ncbi:MAG TPA: Rrf2 family transcriptional regulator [Roseiflexaceae bacterium]|nr:Rrf2 family transcriptional regulator [Roseiflexaceae bacterium]